MPINVPNCGISYFPIPKVACSSFKHFFFEINTGHSYSDFRQKNNFGGGIHQLPDYKTRRGSLACYADIIPSFKRMYVIRDPFRRIFSAYKDKILNKTYLDKDSIRILGKLKLEEQPSFGAFLSNIKGYSSASSNLNRHITTSEFFLPPKLSPEDIVLRLEDKESIASFCQSVSDSVRLRKRNISRQPVDKKFFELDEKQFALGLDYLEKEYAFLSQHYEAPSFEQAKEIVK